MITPSNLRDLTRPPLIIPDDTGIGSAGGGVNNPPPSDGGGIISLNPVDRFRVGVSDGLPWVVSKPSILPDKPVVGQPYNPVPTGPVIPNIPEVPGPKTSATSCPEGQSKLAAGSTRVYSDGTRFTNTSGADMCVATDTAPTDNGSGSKTPTTTGTNGSTDTGPAADSALINSLLGLVANMYAGAGTSGGGTGYDGLVSAPIADSTGAAPTSSGKNPLVILILGVAVVAGLWYWHKHKGQK